MSNRYLIGSGFFARRESQKWFYHIWEDNTFNTTSPAKVLVLSAAGQKLDSSRVQWTVLNGDLGHVVSGVKAAWSGWSISMCTLALMAYAEECDFIFKEQDALCFGPWVNQMYAELGTASMICGRNRSMVVANSVFLVRHDWIPMFVSTYLGMGDERDPKDLGEQKMFKMICKFPKICKFYNFGYDRDRPFNPKDAVFNVQQLTSGELILLRDHGLISFEGDPPEGGFTSFPK